MVRKGAMSSGEGVQVSGVAHPGVEAAAHLPSCVGGDPHVQPQPSRMPEAGIPNILLTNSQVAGAS